jgi:DNA-binding NarL/FixJ family response regulator
MVVEDFLPFRDFVCNELAKLPALQVICKVSDGLEAVRKAKELQPDLILLDIGLPTLNGMSAAQEILQIAPESKIIFVTQESSPDVVHEALTLGARGYVVKTRARVDLRVAVQAVLEGRQFVSDGIAGFR